MPVRKLQRGDSALECGDSELVSGVVAEPLTQRTDQRSSEKSTDRSDQPSPKLQPESSKGGTANNRVGMAAQEIIAALHEAKQELASEMEANLKQLKSVLQETQRIAKEMEAVLQETKVEGNAKETSQGGPQGDRQKQAAQGAQQRHSGQQRDDEANQGGGRAGGRQQQAGGGGWEPPPYREDKEADDDLPPWEPPVQPRGTYQSQGQ